MHLFSLAEKVQELSSLVLASVVSYKATIAFVAIIFLVQLSFWTGQGSTSTSLCIACVFTNEPLTVRYSVISRSLPLQHSLSFSKLPNARWVHFSTNTHLSARYSVFWVQLYKHYQSILGEEPFENTSLSAALFRPLGFSRFSPCVVSTLYSHKDDLAIFRFPTLWFRVGRDTAWVPTLRKTTVGCFDYLLRVYLSRSLDVSMPFFYHHILNRSIFMVATRFCLHLLNTYYLKFWAQSQDLFSDCLSAIYRIFTLFQIYIDIILKIKCQVKEFFQFSTK